MMGVEMMRLVILAALLLAAATAGNGAASADSPRCDSDDRPSWIGLVNDISAPDTWRFEWGEWPVEVEDYSVYYYVTHGSGGFGFQERTSERRFPISRDDVWRITSFSVGGVQADGTRCGSISWAGPSRQSSAPLDLIIDSYKARIDDLQENGGRLGRVITEKNQRIRELEGELAAVPSSVETRVSVLGGRIWLHHRDGRQWRLSGSFEWADCTIIAEPRVVCLTTDVPTGKPGG